MRRYFALALLLLVSACGRERVAMDPTGDGTGSLSVLPLRAEVSPGGSITLTASGSKAVSGVVWSVEAGNGKGSVSDRGIYFAPQEFGDTEISVTATSLSDPEVSTTAVLSVRPEAITVVLDGPASTIASGGRTDFGCHIVGLLDDTVRWSTDIGTISSSGFFVAPIVSSTTIATITATSAALPSAKATHHLSIAPSAPQDSPTEEERSALTGAFNVGYSAEMVNIIMSGLVVGAVRMADERSGNCGTIAGTLTQVGDSWTYSGDRADALELHYQNGDLMRFEIRSCVYDCNNPPGLIGPMTVDARVTFNALELDDILEVTCDVTQSETEITASRSLNWRPEQSSMNLTTHSTLAVDEQGNAALWSGTCTGTLSRAGATETIDESWNRTFWEEYGSFLVGTRVVSRSSVSVGASQLKFNEVDAYSVITDGKVARSSLWRLRGTVERSQAPVGVLAFNPAVQDGQYESSVQVQLRLASGAPVSLGSATDGQLPSIDGTSYRSAAPSTEQITQVASLLRRLGVS